MQNFTCSLLQCAFCCMTAVFTPSFVLSQYGATEYVLSTQAQFDGLNLSRENCFLHSLRICTGTARFARFFFELADIF